MCKIRIVLVLAAWMFFVTSTGTSQIAKEVLTNASVIEMVKAGVPESNIVLKIQQSEPNFDTSAKALIELSKEGVSQKIMEAMMRPQTAKSASQTKTDPANAIATKDIGSLRVVLTSVVRVNLPNEWGSSGVNGIRCSFEFINLETQRPIVVAMNAIGREPRTQELGRYMRSTLVDENGGMWRLSKSDVAGIAVIGVGQPFYNAHNYDPTEIVSALSKRDDLNSDFGKTDFGNGNVEEYRFIYGSTTEVAPGQSRTVTITFAQVTEQTKTDAPPKFFQLATELVVGVLTAGTKKTYSLHNLSFDRVSLSGSGW